MKSIRVGIGIGSNLGDRRAWMAKAFAFLRSLDERVKISRIYESCPVDCPEGAGDFLNAAAELGWEGGLESLLDRLQAFESACGRLPAGARGTNQPRTVDLDLLYADDLVIRSERLTLPHPRAGERLFVLMPLAEICPDRRLAGDFETVAAKSLRRKGELLAAGQVCRPAV
jgi:2-amino-4-hydroxy-6-hydroxymethyldihydropteridine diphosphokinase